MERASEFLRFRPTRRTLFCADGREPDSCCRTKDGTGLCVAAQPAVLLRFAVAERSDDAELTGMVSRPLAAPASMDGRLFFRACGGTVPYRNAASAVLQRCPWVASASARLAGYWTVVSP